MIPGVQTFHPRESWVDPRYPITGPVDNPANNDTVVIHYTAADNLIDGDPGEHASNLPAYMRAMQRSYVTNRGYSLGYLFAVDWLGGVWQIRGWEFQSAANKNHNDHTWPVLMLVDGDDEATAEAAASVRFIVAEAERRAGRPQTIDGHRDIGSTTCPGAGLYRQVKDGTFDPSPVAPPPPTDTEDDDMAKPEDVYIARPPAGMPDNPPWFVVERYGGGVRYAMNADAGNPAIEQIEVNADQYSQLYRAVYG